MAKQQNCICGTPVNRTKGKYYDNAMGATGSCRLSPTFGATIQLCSSCMSEFIRSRPRHDSPTDGGVHTLCDFCNDEITASIFTQLFRRPRITRWEGKVPHWNGNRKDVCTDCYHELKYFIDQKRTED